MPQRPTPVSDGRTAPTAHASPAAERLAALGTHPEHGLEPAEAEARLGRHGPNQITERRTEGPLRRLLEQFRQPLVLVLLAAAAVSALLKGMVDAAVVLGVVVVNALIGFLQESRALQAVQALGRALVSQAAVVRGGRRLQLDARELVPGDLVLLQAGDRVPADLRLLQARELAVDESALTGESLPVEKHPGALAVDTPLADRRNMTYASTLVTRGTGTAVVEATGDDTEIGRIADLIASAEVLATPLTRRIARFTRVLLVTILGVSAATFAIGLWRGEPLGEAVLAVVALAVGAIPEGLPAAVTIMLAIGVARMARRRAIIRRLPTVETLGSTTVICTDKTGTLTRNEMTVQELVAGGETFQVSGTGYAPAGELLLAGRRAEADAHPALRECLRAGVLCNDAALDERDGRWTLQGDPTEGALLAVARKAGLVHPALRAAAPRLDAVPFDSEYQYMATLHGAPDGGAPVAYVKGALESLLPRCVARLDARGGEIALDPAEVRAWGEDTLARQGLRVLAFARRAMPPGQRALGHGDVAGGLVLLGLQGMVDPPRAEAAPAVAACHRAGIRVKMITGDHPGTAAAIARQIGLAGAGGPGVEPITVTGRDLEAMDDAALEEAAERATVFARVTPEHKLRLVRALQARRHVVAMTGDGVNDGPALRRADIGVAMALGGTEVAREAADMVLTDDNFASIEAAVEEGRGVFDNLVKFILWTLPTNGSEGLVIMLAMALGVALPILPVQILWINMTSAVCLGLMLAFEPREPGIMNRPPRDPRAPLLDGVMLTRIAYVSLLLCGGAFGVYEWRLSAGAPAAEARTAAVAAIVMGETFYLLNCRSLGGAAVGAFSNPWLWAGIAGMLALQALFTYAPVMNHMFHSAPLGAATWGWLALFGLALSVVVSLEKRGREAWRRRTGSRARRAKMS